MPEIRFKIEWPDGQQETCYSPSLIVQEYFEPGATYTLTDFVERSRTALNIASDRVKAKYGRPCGLAIGQLQTLESRATNYADLTSPQVKLIQFIP
ncbi:MSMEG_0570 family nitrogen starvation response protein [filamentous cyanobacterium LEGE 11480]|uniref:MSMEG_0570 family nitrogen starvation response protein n=1 Tax=Romeriopsis navalis LEGE 11480 TaxID=2777977 RepID=A0A928VM04_9CYAN|nr:MSMEG_0570 family nitrogen starvation response protein [Romeriopsis navalis]MBE9028822.1 MSMEG_0570 family nitrogen starvation response protein [Romeriopsis navalis LEGE 11480]